MSYPDYSVQGWQHILVSLDGPVAIVKLNRTKQYANPHTVLLYRPAAPQADTFWKYRRNTFTLPAVNDLVAAYELFDLDDRVRVVVLTADPTADAFCAGVRAFFFCSTTSGSSANATSFPPISASPPPQADISAGWGSLFSEEDERQGRHCECCPFEVSDIFLCFETFSPPLAPMRLAQLSGIPGAR
jgi:hypothetical protein